MPYAVRIPDEAWTSLRRVDDAARSRIQELLDHAANLATQESPISNEWKAAAIDVDTLRFEVGRYEIRFCLDDRKRLVVLREVIFR